MPLHLVLVSDTHVPHRARDLPAQVWAAVESADVVLHAGDWVSAELLDEFERRSRRLIGTADCACSIPGRQRTAGVSLSART